jgi:hypothetical protein
VQLPDQFLGRGLWLQVDRDVPQLGFGEVLHIRSDHNYINPLVFAEVERLRHVEGVKDSVTGERQLIAEHRVSAGCQIDEGRHGQKIPQTDACLSGNEYTVGMPRKKNQSEASKLKGWKAIAGYLRIPAGTAQRWAKDGMPVQHEGRFTVADPKELSAWLVRESHMPGPAQVMTNGAGVADALKASIAATRRAGKS